MNNDDERDSAEEAFNEALLHDETEVDETWDTGEVRLHLNNDEGLYNAARRELPGVSADEGPEHLRWLWVEHDLNDSVDEAKVDWELLTNELIEDINGEDEAASCGTVRADQSLTSTGLRLGYQRDDGVATWSVDLLGESAPSPLLGITEADGVLHIFHWPDGEEAVTLVRLDTASSASRQHFIDTGRYLRAGEVQD